MIKDDVLNVLRTLGFIPEEIEDFGYRFEYEGLSLLYSVDDDESKCVTIVVPGIFDITEDNRLFALESMLKLCGKMKYVQPNIVFNDQVWLNYQHYLGDNPVSEDLIEHMIRVLAISTANFHRIVNGDDNGN